MSHSRIVGRMIRRAQEARRSADANLSTGLFSLACISAYQFVSLMLKARVIERTGLEPRAKGISGLLMALGETLGRSDDIAEFMEKVKDEIAFFEELYERSKASASPCSREEAEKAVMIADKLVSFVENLVAGAGPVG